MSDEELDKEYQKFYEVGLKAERQIAEYEAWKKSCNDSTNSPQICSVPETPMIQVETFFNAEQDQDNSGPAIHEEPSTSPPVDVVEMNFSPGNSIYSIDLICL